MAHILSCIALFLPLLLFVVAVSLDAKVIEDARNNKNVTCQKQTCQLCTLSPSGSGPGSCCNKTYTCYDDPVFGYPICLPPYPWICAGNKYTVSNAGGEKKKL